MAATLVLSPQQRLTRVSQDRSAKGLVYIVCSRDSAFLLLCQSLPLLCRFINSSLSNEACDSVSITSFHDNLNRVDGRNGGYVSGRWRIRTLPLAEAGAEFERERSAFENALVVASDPRMYAVGSNADP
jgi:hypothetical protein